MWAGWGHASENPKLPEMLKKVGITFIGPPASAMDALGDKIASTIVAQSALVPTLSWNGDGVTIPMPEGQAVIQEVPDFVYEKGSVKTADQGVAAAGRIGYPVMIKVTTAA